MMPESLGYCCGNVGVLFLCGIFFMESTISNEQSSTFHFCETEIWSPNVLCHSHDHLFQLKWDGSSVWQKNPERPVRLQALTNSEFIELFETGFDSSLADINLISFIFIFLIIDD